MTTYSLDPCMTSFGPIVLCVSTNVEVKFVINFDGEYTCKFYLYCKYGKLYLTMTIEWELFRYMALFCVWLYPHSLKYPMDITHAVFPNT